MVGSAESISTQPKATEFHARSSECPHRAFIDLTIEVEAHEAAEVHQEVPKATNQEIPQNEENSPAIPAIESLLPGLSEAASIFSDSLNNEPETDRRESQSPPAPLTEPREQSFHIDMDEQGAGYAGDKTKSSEISTESTAEPPQPQTQEDKAKVVESYQFVSTDSVVEELNKPLNLHGFDNDAEAF